MEQEHQHRIDHHQALRHHGGEPVHQLLLRLRIAGLQHLHALRQMPHHRQRLDLLVGLALRGVADQVGLDPDLALAIVPRNRRRPLAELDVGDGEQRHRAPAQRRHAQLLEHLLVGAAGFSDHHADGDETVADVELGEARTDIADSRDAHGRGERFGGDVQARRKRLARDDAELGTVERGGGDDIGDGWQPPHLVGELGGDVRHRPAFRAGDDARNRALAVLVEEPVADIGNVGEVAADRLLELRLGDGAVLLRHVVDDQRGGMDLGDLGRNASTIDEDAADFRPPLQHADDFLRHRLGRAELRAGRQFDREQRTRRVLLRQESLRQELEAENR